MSSESFERVTIAVDGADPDAFFGHFLDTRTRVPGAISDDVRGRYLAACGRPATIAAIYEDYRASASVDVERDRADEQAPERCVTLLRDHLGAQPPGVE